MVKQTTSASEGKGQGESQQYEMIISSASHLSHLEVEIDDGHCNNGLVVDIDQEHTGGDEENKIDTERSLRSYAFSPLGAAVENTLACVIPKIERIPWHHFFFLSFIVAVPAASYIIGFTKLGYGLTTFYFLSTYFEEQAYILAIGIASFALVLYILDFHYWESKCGRFWRRLAIAIIVLGIATLVCFISSSHPYGPISIYIMLTPMWLVMIKHLFYKDLEMRTYVPWLSGPLFFNAILVLLLWICWTFSTAGNKWTEASRLADAQRSGCIPDFEDYPECEVDVNDEDELRFMHLLNNKRRVCFEIDQKNPQLPKFTEDCTEACIHVYDDCPNIFIVWVGPFLVSLGLFFLSFFATFLKATGTIEQEATKFAKVWFFLIFVLWISSSLAGSGAGVSVTLGALTLSAFVASAILIASSFTHAERKEKAFELWMKLLEGYRKYLNVAKGLLVLTSAPIFAVYLGVSFIRQTIRNINLPCASKRNGNTESLRNVIGHGVFTVEARRLIREVKSWDLVDVITYAIIWGIVITSFLAIAPQFTTLLLSWIIEETSEMSIPMVTVILFIVGLIMFLLPPVPGAPIYLTLGIVIVPVGSETFGVPCSILYAMAISLVLKLFATFLQQKMIGGLLKGKVGIRQAVGINTPLIRAMKLILSERGLGLAKVSILCGGPDWPTSVLCGIMDLSLMPVIVGTIPVLTLIAPTVLAGSFTYLSSLKDENGEPEYSWASTANTMSLSAAAIVLFGFILLAAYYVELTLRERKDDIKAIPIDEEVKKYDDQQALSIVIFKEVTQWSLVPWWARLILMCSLLANMTSCYMLLLFAESAFTPYQLTYTIDKHLNGDLKNFVKPFGLIALAFFVASIVLFLTFNFWAKGVAGKKLKEKEKANNTSPPTALALDDQNIRVEGET